VSQIQKEGTAEDVPQMDKSWNKKIHTIGEKFRKSLPRKLKLTHVDEIKNPSKKSAFSFKQGETTNMPPPKARPPKHKKVLELSSDDDFLSRPIQSMGKSTLPHSTNDIFGLPCFLHYVVVQVQSLLDFGFGFYLGFL